MYSELVRCIFTEDRSIRYKILMGWKNQFYLHNFLTFLNHKLTFSCFFIVKRINFYLAISASIDVIDVMLLILQSKQKVIVIMKEAYLKKSIQLKYPYAGPNFCVSHLLSRTNFLLLEVLSCFYPFGKFSVFLLFWTRFWFFFLP